MKTRIMLVTSLLVVMQISFSIETARAQNYVVLNTFDVNIRTGPGIDHFIVCSANKGEIFKLVNKDNDWLEIEMYSGDNRFVHRDLVYFLEEFVPGHRMTLPKSEGKSKKTSPCSVRPDRADIKGPHITSGRRMARNGRLSKGRFTLYNKIQCSYSNTLTRATQATQNSITRRNHLRTCPYTTTPHPIMSERSLPSLALTVMTGAPRSRSWSRTGEIPATCSI